MPERTALPCEPNGRAWYEVDGVRVRFDCTLPGARGALQALARSGWAAAFAGHPGAGGGRTCAQADSEPRHADGAGRLSRPSGWKRRAASGSGLPPGMTGAGQQSAASWSALSGTDWQRGGAFLTNDPILHGALSDQSGWSWRREEGGKTLPAPQLAEVGMPFPIPPLFCLVRAERGWLIYGWTAGECPFCRRKFWLYSVRLPCYKEGDRAERGAEAMSKGLPRDCRLYAGTGGGVFIYAVSHPEGSFPWSNWITYLIYGIYLAVTVLLFIAPFSLRQRGEKDGMN